MAILTASGSWVVEMVMVPLGPFVPALLAAIAWAALTMRFSITWLNSPAMHDTGTRLGSSCVTTSATYFHSFRATVMVVLMAWLRSTRHFSFPPGCENSFMARTILEI